LTAVTGPNSILGHLAAAGYETLPVATDKELGKEVRYNGGYITDTYGSHRETSIDTIQLEFGSDLRKKERLAKVAGDVGKAIKAFAEAYLPKATKE
jgi:N-formylglutamate amidohydrolase